MVGWTLPRLEGPVLRLDLPPGRCCLAQYFGWLRSLGRGLRQEQRRTAYFGAARRQCRVLRRKPLYAWQAHLVPQPCRASIHQGLLLEKASTPLMNTRNSIPLLPPSLWAPPYVHLWIDVTEGRRQTQWEEHKRASEAQAEYLTTTATRETHQEKRYLVTTPKLGNDPSLRDCNTSSAGYLSHPITEYQYHNNIMKDQ